MGQKVRAEVAAVWAVIILVLCGITAQAIFTLGTAEALAESTANGQ